MEDKREEEPLVVLSNFQKELSGLEIKYQTYMHALSETNLDAANNALQHVILLESAIQDFTVQPDWELP